MLNYKLIRSVIVLKTGLGLETGLKTSPFFEGLVLVSDDSDLKIGQDHNCEDITKLPVHCRIYLFTSLM